MSWVASVTALMLSSMPKRSYEPTLRRGDACVARHGWAWEKRARQCRAPQKMLCIFWDPDSPLRTRNSARSAERRVAADVPHGTEDAELRQRELIRRMQHLRAPALGSAPVDHDLRAILPHQQDAGAGRVCPVDLPLALDHV